MSIPVYIINLAQRSFEHVLYLSNDEIGPSRTRYA